MEKTKFANPQEAAEWLEDVRRNNNIVQGMVENSMRQHPDLMVKHDLTHFRDVVDGVHGMNLKGRLGYNLHRAAQSILRTALRDALNADATSDALAQYLTDDELSEMFGSETKPLYALDKAIDWVMATYLFTHDVSQYTESDDRGMKVRPYSWMEQQIATPFHMVVADAQYGIKAATDQQSLEMVKFGYREKAQDSLEKFKANRATQAEEMIKEKIALLKANCDFAQYKSLSSEELCERVEEFVATTGLSIPVMLADIAQKYVDANIKRFDEGKQVFDADERIIAFAPVRVTQKEQAKQAKQAKQAEQAEQAEQAKTETPAEKLIKHMVETGKIDPAEVAKVEAESVPTPKKRSMKRIPKATIKASIN